MNKKTFMLLLTENCNLKCVYCYEHHKTSNCMTYDTAKQVIDNNINELDEDVMVEIELFGGEPFLKFELIKKIVDYVVLRYPKRNIYFTATTNGTLIHGEVQNWLKENCFRFRCTLSLDGTKEMHNLNRHCVDEKIDSFSLIDIPFFVNTWLNPCAKMTISELTIENMAEGIIYIESLGFYCIATFASGIRWNIDTCRVKLMSEMNKLIKYYSKNSEKKVCQLFNYDFRYIFYPLDQNFRYCGAGIQKVCFDIYGRKYPCQGLTELSTGTDIFRETTFENFRLDDSNKCVQCKWIRLCRTCYAANYFESKNVEKTSSDICYLNRMSILASTTIHFNRIIKKDTQNEEDLIVLKAIETIQNEIFS